MPFKDPRKRREYQRSIRKWRVEYNRRYHRTLRGRALFLNSRHRYELRRLKQIEKRKRQRNGWPDIRFSNGFLVEEKQGLDFLSAEQIAAHRWIHKHFGVWVKIDYYPRIKGVQKRIRFSNYKEFIAYLEQWKRPA